MYNFRPPPALFRACVQSLSCKMVLTYKFYLSKPVTEWLLTIFFFISFFLNTVYSQVKRKIIKTDCSLYKKFTKLQNMFV